MPDLASSGYYDTLYARTELLKAAKTGSVLCLRVLLEKGVDPDAKDDDAGGRTSGRNRQPLSRFLVCNRVRLLTAWVGRRMGEICFKISQVIQQLKRLALILKVS